MNTSEQIHIQGFRRLLDAKIKLTPLNVLIGANGSGKTSILDVFWLLANTAAGKLNECLSEQNGVDANLSNLTAAMGGKARFLAFELSMPVTNSNPIAYRLAIAPKRPSKC